jgi:alkanesulfonate monooxygenase SsuD/methylene tetrahydromethanopterin reductase-like flavin-dependent oxidoreductase (luciferase family)
LRETINLLRAWWQPPYRAASPSGSQFRIRDWERSVAPLQPPPIYLAAAGPKTLALAGELADGVIFNVLTSEDALSTAIPQAREAAITAGRDPDTLAFILRTEVALTADEASERKALSRAKSLFALLAGFPGMSGLYPVAGYDSWTVIASVRTAMRTDEVLSSGGGFPALRRTGDLPAARAAIPDNFIRSLALVGNLATLTPRLETLRDLGVTCVSVAPPSDPESMQAWEKLLAALRQATR